MIQFEKVNRPTLVQSMSKKRIKLLLFLFFCFTVYCIFWMKSVREEKQINMKELLLDGLLLLETAGVEIVKLRNSPDLSEKVKGMTREGAKELMTKADLASHHIITNTLKKRYKYLKIVSEEHDDEVGSSVEGVDLIYNSANIDTLSNIIDPDQDLNYNSDDLLVWIDPLDATQEYMENLTEYVTVMMCVAYRDRPILGIIHQPFHKRSYWALKNRDSSYLSWMRSDEEEDVNRTSGGVGILVSRSHAGQVKGVVEEALKGENVSVIAAGGAGYKGLQTLNSSSLFYLHTTHIKKWDICAPDALSSISGGGASDLGGDLIGYSDPKEVVNQNGLLITSKGSLLPHDLIIKRIKDSKSKSSNS